jgi:hypothetical protein
MNEHRMFRFVPGAFRFGCCMMLAAAMLFALLDSPRANAEPPRPVRKGAAHGRDAGLTEAGAAQPAKVEARALVVDAGALVKGEAVSTKTLDGGAKIYRFGELEIESRLKSPQLVYFLRRVRAEFAAGDLGHRSFMGELSETRDQSAF